jgi:hypothetical protein
MKEIGKQKRKETEQKKESKQAAGPNLAQARIRPTAQLRPIPNGYAAPSFFR